jgi:methyl-accepting chemotaxis protein
MSVDFNTDPRSTIEPDQQGLVNVEELPLVVWLRGDESYADEFTVDAAEAMGFLNIKRSRLTQISGTQLRVARIRMGQHIRPLYRQKDLDDYANVTRAPASHQKSAKLVNETIEKWQDTVDEIIRSTSQCLNHLGEEIRSQNKNFQEKIVKTHARDLGKFAAELTAVSQRVDLLVESAAHYQQAFHKKASDLMAQVDRSNQSVEPLGHDVAGLKRSLRLLQQDVNQNAMAAIAHHEESLLTMKLLHCAIQTLLQKAAEAVPPAQIPQRTHSRKARERYQSRTLSY